MDYVAEIAKVQLPFLPVNIPRAKRAFDIIVSILLTIALSPFIVCVVVLILLEELFISTSRGPILYSEIRISKGKPFRIYKFRIFKIASSQSYFNQHGFVQTKALEEDKNNLTLVGRFLKQIYMDELPQLINVFKGEMSLVGPRPSNEVVTWHDGQARIFQRYVGVCGITGPFQVVKDVKLQANQNQLDMEYIIFCRDNPGWKVVQKDFKLLWNTIWTVLRAKGI